MRATLTVFVLVSCLAASALATAHNDNIISEDLAAHTRAACATLPDEQSCASAGCTWKQSLRLCSAESSSTMVHETVLEIVAPLQFVIGVLLLLAACVLLLARQFLMDDSSNKADDDETAHLTKVVEV